MSDSSKNDTEVPAGTHTREFVVYGDPAENPCPLPAPELLPGSLDEADLSRLRRLAGTEDHETGANSKAVFWRLTSSCAGWAEKPTPQEFYEALRAPLLTARQKNIVWTWVNEAELSEIVTAYIEAAYDWPLLAAAMQRCECTTRYPLNRYLCDMIAPLQHPLPVEPSRDTPNLSP